MQCKTIIKGILTASMLSASLMSFSVPSLAKPLTLVQATTQASDQLTQEKITQVIAAIQKAQKEKNVEGVTKFLAPFASAEVTRRSSDVSIVSQLVGKDKLVEYVRLTYELIKSREILEQEVNVNIVEGGQLGIATIRTVKQTTTMDGKEYYSASLDVIHFALIDKSPMIVFFRTQGWVAERPTNRK